MPDPFKIGINMAGAVSAGAYTAGVLDFLMEALEQWQKAKDELHKYLSNPIGLAPTHVPLHDVSIEIFTGASAGGMCAAIASVMVQQDFDHIHTGHETATNNTFYESWVNKIDIRELLKTDDVKNGSPLTSLLDCTIIDTIATSALTPATPKPRPYVSQSLTLILTLTNVRGVPYQIYEDPNPGTEEFIEYFGDRLRFEVTSAGAAPSASDAKPLPSGLPGAGAWSLLQEAGKATGAFPIFLAPRVLPRDIADYLRPQWQPPCTSRGSSGPEPSLPQSMKTWQTLNVDGGVTDNNPFDLADHFLAQKNPFAENCENPSEPLRANCAVVTVAPFPVAAKYVPDYDPATHSQIWPMLGRLATVLISQSRFLGESLERVAGGPSFSRFVIAPSDPGRSDFEALQCAALSAFGGFFERGFRVHDFLLGRRNCQKFLMTHFCLPIDNPIIATGLTNGSPFASQIKSSFCIEAPDQQAKPQGRVWMPVIPLVGSAVPEVPEPARAKISADSLDKIVDLLLARLRAIKSKLLDGAPGFVKFLVAAALTWPFSLMIKGAIRNALASGLAGSIADPDPASEN